MKKSMLSICFFFNALFFGYCQTSPPVISCRDTTVNVSTGLCSTAIILDMPQVTGGNGFTLSNDHPSTEFLLGNTAVTWTLADAGGNQASCITHVIVHSASFPVISNCPPDIFTTITPGTCGRQVDFSMPTATDMCIGIIRPDSAVFNFIGAVQHFVVPSNVTNIRLAATGAAGGDQSIETGVLAYRGGRGAYMSGDFTVTPGQHLYIMVGGKGDGMYWDAGGGGGGTFICSKPAFDDGLLIAAGGGGGTNTFDFPIDWLVNMDASISNGGNSGGSHDYFPGAAGGSSGYGGTSDLGEGGAGWLTNGGNSGQCSPRNMAYSPRNGGYGGLGYCGNGGGYGGGGSALAGGGGGGGYSGGGGGGINGRGGGGGSFNAGANQYNVSGAGTGNGQVKIYFNRVFPDIEQIAGLTPGSVFPVGTTTNTWMVTNAAGNTDTCSNTVTVIDNEPPSIQCQSDIVVNTDPGQCTAIVYFSTPMVGENCHTHTAIAGYHFIGELNNHSYFLSDSSLSFDDAMQAAQALGGQLAAVNNQTENSFLANALWQQDLSIWLGGFQNHNNPAYAEPSGGWEWLDGSPFNAYTNWHGNEPNNAVAEDYLEMYSDGTWNDANSSVLRYVVEFDMSPTLTQIAGPASGSHFPAGTTIVSWRATDLHGNTASCSFIVTVNRPVLSTGNISGPVNVCPYINTGEQISYSTAASPTISNYQWSVPPTVSIVSGQGTNTLTVSIGSGFAANVNKVIKVRGLTACGAAGPEKLLYLQANYPATAASIIASSTDVCAAIGSGTAIQFRIPKIEAATSYIWTAQSGTTTISHPNGPGVNDTIVSVLFSSGFTTSNITVQAANSCGTGTTRSLTITKNSASIPSLISGPVNVCPHIGATGTAAIYSVPAIAGNTYNWTVPSGATGLTGQGTNSISFNFPDGFTGGNVSVTATNGCGTSGPRSLAVTKLSPATPSPIDVIQTAQCPDRIFTYSLSAMPANATSVQWTVPVDATGLTGQGTASITVHYPSTAVIGTVTAQAVSNCGVSTIRSTQVKLPACPPPGVARVINNEKQKAITAEPVKGFSVTVMPNPSIADFKIIINSESDQPVQMMITDLAGKIVDNRIVSGKNSSIVTGNSLVAGTYIAHFVQGEQKKAIRLVKL